MKRSRLKPMSAKRAAREAEIREARLEYRREMGSCCIGGCKSVPGSVHEIVGGSVRQRTERDRRFWLACCWEHHLGILQDMPWAEQLAIKRHVDPDCYNLAVFNQMASGHVDGVKVTANQVQRAKLRLQSQGIIRIGTNGKRMP